MGEGERRVSITLVGYRVTPLLTSRPPKAVAPGRLPREQGVHLCRLVSPRSRRQLAMSHRCSESEDLHRVTCRLSV